MTLMRGVGLVVLTPVGVRQRSDISRTAFELRSLMRPCLSSEKLFPHPVGEPPFYPGSGYIKHPEWDIFHSE